MTCSKIAWFGEPGRGPLPVALPVAFPRRVISGGTQPGNGVFAQVNARSPNSLKKLDVQGSRTDVESFASSVLDVCFQAESPRLLIVGVRRVAFLDPRPP